jgi:hypothetical protein
VEPENKIVVVVASIGSVEETASGEIGVHLSLLEIEGFFQAAGRSS